MAKGPRAILTPEFRLSFFDLFEACANKLDKTVRFRAEMLFPKAAGGSQFRDMKSIYDEVLQPLRASGPEPVEFKAMVVDGDKKRQDGRKGQFIVRAYSGEDFKPRLLLPNGDIAGKADFYPGMFCRAVITAYPWKFQNEGVLVKQGAGYNLLTVQKTRDGQPFGNFVSESEQDELLRSAPLPQEEADDLLA